MKLSIIIPVFNEEKTIIKVLEKVINLKIKGAEVEIIVVDDGSSDKTARIVEKFNVSHKKIKLYKHTKNSGKGSAVRTGIKNAHGDYVVIQDADLEYDPDDIPMLCSNIKTSKSVIYGTRLARLPHFDHEERRARFFIHYLGNRFLSLVTSALYGQWITDMETCYKLFPRKYADEMILRSKRFDFEPEITAKLLKKGLKITEVPIKANPRGYEEGKKLNTVRDGAIALWTLVKFRFTN